MLRVSSERNITLWHFSTFFYVKIIECYKQKWDIVQICRYPGIIKEIRCICITFMMTSFSNAFRTLSASLVQFAFQRTLKCSAKWNSVKLVYIVRAHMSLPGNGNVKCLGRNDPCNQKTVDLIKNSRYSVLVKRLLYYTTQKAQKC